ncbi:5-(carboxyamino)imidazole ribonucleotide synthase [Bowdeniella massiliensis]|uniref:5-(carboxyamino)imidazole ribonucleotide synthase n=1 Tax=Bowdeniella massiliensis TaxID=2932264 RepID=UPI002027FDB3
MKSNVVAVIGGGQLARMMQQAAGPLDVRLRALVEAADGATAQVVPESFVGDPSDEEAVRALLAADGASRLALTFEHEHQDTELLQRLAAEGVSVQPPPNALLYARDKLKMRERLSELGAPVPDWAIISSASDLDRFLADHGGEAIVKTARGGYDGKGVRLVTDAEDIADWLAGDIELIAEEKVPFDMEVAALLARRPSGEMRHWELTQTIQEDGVCAVAIAPAPEVNGELRAEARRIAELIAEGLGVTGVLAVEMFVTGSRLLVNELAMRPHNSGHWTIEGATTSQFEQHLRAVLDLPLGATDMRAPHAVMTNVLGSELSDPAEAYPEVMARFSEVKVHLYGKGVRPGRKLGHVSAIGDDLAALTERTAAAAALLRGERRDK